MKFKFCGDLDCPDWVLSEVSTLSKMSSIRIKLLVAQIIEYCLQGSFNYDKVLRLAADNAEGVSDIKGAVAAAHFMIVNAAKYNIDDISLLQEIQQLGLPKENSEALSKQYKDNKNNLRSKLAMDSYKISKLLKTDWRIDHIISSSEKSSSSAKKSEEEDEVELSVHLKLVIDKQPHLSTARPDQPDGKRVVEMACELTVERLDLLIDEVASAHDMLVSMQS